MTAPTRVAITGATGRLGRALLARLGRDENAVAIPWGRREFDLDSGDPETDATALLERDRL